MIFIFDWGHKTIRNAGPLSAEDADFKMDAEYVFLIEEKTWFRMFFIPTIVTERRFYYKDSDSDNIEMINKDTFTAHRDLANLNLQMMNDEISEDEYREKRKEL